MKKTVAALFVISALSACTEPVMETGVTYPPISPGQVRISFSSVPDCSGATEIGLIPQVGSNKYSQNRAINEIKKQSASRGANLALLSTEPTSLLGDMLIDAVMYRCP